MVGARARGNWYVANVILHHRRRSFPISVKTGGVQDTLNALITFLIFFNIIVYGYGPLKRLIKRQKEGIIALKNSSTLLFVTYQIIVELSAVHQFAGGYGYPGSTKRT